MSPALTRTKLALAFWAGLAFAAPLTAQEAELSIPEARNLAMQAALDGQAETARSLAAVLLQANPNDRAALLVLAVVEPQLGRPTQGRLAGARAFAQSTTDPERYEAARLTALAAANEGRFTLAGWWLRRALAVAPTQADAAQTVADAQGLRNLNPWSSNVALSLAPSGNVNGGADSRFNVIDGIPFVGILSPDAQALSGWSGTLDLRTSYRLSSGADFQTLVSARAYRREVLLSRDAREFLEAEGSTASARDFGSALLEFALRHDRALTRGTFGLDLTAGQAWSAGAFDYSFLRVGASRRVPLSDADALSFSGSLEQRWDDDDIPSDWRRDLQISWAHQTAAGNQISTVLGQSDVTSEFVNDTSVTSTLQFNYALARQIGPAQVQFSLGVQWQDFEFYRVGIFAVPGGRQDLRVFGSVDLFFADYSYAGFAPVVTLNAGRTDSNVSRFDRDDLSIGFAIRSTF